MSFFRRGTQEKVRVDRLWNRTQPRTTSGAIAQSGVGGPPAEHDHKGTGDGGVLTDAKHDGADDFTAIATPASPAASHLSLYAKLSGGIAKLFYKQSDGTEVGPLAAAGAAAAHDHTTADGSGVLTDDEHDGFSLYTEIATPSAPAANKMSFYGKDLGGRTWPHFLSEAGPERVVCANAHTHSGALSEASAINPATLDLPAAASPSQTADGRIVWDSDDNLLTVGDGGSRQTFYPLARSYSRRQYVFVPDAAPGATITAGDAQGPILHSGPNDETADALEVDAETAPGASGLPITVQRGDTNDLDTVASWTTIATLTLSSEKSSRTTSMTNATVTAARLLRMNVGTIVGTPKDCTVTLHTKAPLVA